MYRLFSKSAFYLRACFYTSTQYLRLFVQVKPYLGLLTFSTTTGNHEPLQLQALDLQRFRGIMGMCEIFFGPERTSIPFWEL